MLIFAIEFLEIVALYLKAHFKKMSEVETLINEIQYYGHTKHILYFQKQNSVL